MKKVLINICYGVFGLSKEVYDILGLDSNHGDIYPEDLGYNTEEKMRADKTLIAAVEKVGLKESSGEYAELKIVEIPDDVEFTIEEYDGLEWIAEKHRTWE